MKSLFNHIALASFYLYLDNLLLSKGETFYNVTETLFQTQEPASFSGYYEYMSVRNQFVYDSSISTAIIPSGVSVNSVFVPRGTSGLAIDFYNGQVLFTGSQNNVSITTAVKEINLYPTTESEEVILFEKKYFENPKNTPNRTTRALGEKFAPCIFIKNKYSSNEKACLGGALVSTEMTFRLVVVTQNNFHYEGICSILRDCKDTYFPILSETALPFNFLGDFKSGGTFDYLAIKTAALPNDLFLIKDVKISPFDTRINKEIATNCVGGFIDVTVENYRIRP